MCLKIRQVAIVNTYLPGFVRAYMSFLYRCQTTGATVTDAATPAAGAKTFDFSQELYSTGKHCWTR